MVGGGLDGGLRHGVDRVGDDEFGDVHGVGEGRVLRGGGGPQRPLELRPVGPQLLPAFPGEPLLEELIGKPGVRDGRLAAQRRRLRGTLLVQPGIDLGIHPADEERRHRTDLGHVAAGYDLSHIASVASFFVSRVDTEVDKRLEKLGTDEAKALKGTAAIANARLAYELYEQRIDTDRWRALAAKGARVQRPLWASTSTKDPSFPDTMYVTELVAKDTVNTMPEATIHAVADHGEIRGDTIHGTYDASRKVIADLEKLGISYDDVVAVLEDEGVAKFAASWNELLETVKGQLSK